MKDLNLRKAGEGQIGGDHYNSFVIDPMTFNMINKLPWDEGEILKYLVRRKGSRKENLMKANHILNEMIKNCNE